MEHLVTALLIGWGALIGLIVCIRLAIIADQQEYGTEDDDGETLVGV